MAEPSDPGSGRDAAGPEPDHYATLQVPDTASGEEITRAYRRLIRQLHPDANDGADLRRLLEAIDAYQVIGDPVRRRDYDASRWRARTSNPARGASRSRSPAGTSGRSTTGGGARIPVRHLGGRGGNRAPERPAPRADPTGCPTCRGTGRITRTTNGITIRQDCPSCQAGR